MRAFRAGVWGIALACAALAQAQQTDTVGPQTRPDKPPAAAIIRFEPAQIDLGDLRIGEASEMRRVLVRNASGERSRLAAWSVIGDAWIETNCGAELEPGAQCELHMRFTPSAPGMRRAAVLVLDQIHGHSYTLDLLARGVTQAEPSLAASALGSRRRPGPSPRRLGRKGFLKNSPRTRPATPAGWIPSPPVD